MRYISLFVVVMLLSGCNQPKNYEQFHENLTENEAQLKYEPHMYRDLFVWHYRSGRKISAMVVYGLVAEKVMKESNDQFLPFLMKGYPSYQRTVEYFDSARAIREPTVFEKDISDELRMTGLISIHEKKNVIKKLSAMQLETKSYVDNAIKLTADKKSPIYKKEQPI